MAAFWILVLLISSVACATATWDNVKAHLESREPEWAAEHAAEFAERLADEEAGKQRARDAFNKLEEYALGATWERKSSCFLYSVHECWSAARTRVPHDIVVLLKLKTDVDHLRTLLGPIGFDINDPYMGLQTYLTWEIKTE